MKDFDFYVSHSSTGGFFVKKLTLSFDAMIFIYRALLNNPILFKIRKHSKKNPECDIPTS